MTDVETPIVDRLRAELDEVRRELRKTLYLERMAARHASRCDADVAEIDARLAARDAEVARLRALIARHGAQLHDVRIEARRELAEELATALRNRADEPELYVDLDRPEAPEYLLAVAQVFRIAAALVRVEVEQ